MNWKGKKIRNRLMILLISLIVMWIICHNAIMATFWMLMDTTFGPMDWAAFWQNMWNDITWDPIHYAVLFCFVLLAILWYPTKRLIKKIKFRKVFSVWPGDEMANETVESTLKNAANYFGVAANDQTRLQEVRLFVLYDLYSKGQKMVIRFKRRFWELHDLASYFKFPVKNKIGDYLSDHLE